MLIFKRNPNTSSVERHYSVPGNQFTWTFSIVNLNYKIENRIGGCVKNNNSVDQNSS